MNHAEAQFYTGELFAGRYEIQNFLGSGAFSGTFESRDTTTGRQVAVKILSLASSQDATAVFEFHEEVRLLGVLSSCSNVVTLLDHGQHTLQVHTQAAPTPVPMSVRFMVLELATASLDKLLLRRHQIEWADRLLLYRDIVKGAHQIHLDHVVHRDIKSDNVLVFDPPPRAHAKLSDFGRSKDANMPPNVPHHAYAHGRGDPRFLPPELLWYLGEPDPTTHIPVDLYLLGSILFEFATGTGITSVAVGNPRHMMRQALIVPAHDRPLAYKALVPDLRDKYEVVYELFRSQLPGSISYEATALLRQLTDPDPNCRQPRYPFRRLALTWDLQWLLREIDILLKRLAAPSRRSRLPWRAAR